MVGATYLKKNMLNRKPLTCTKCPQLIFSRSNSHRRKQLNKSIFGRETKVNRIVNPRTNQIMLIKVQPAAKSTLHKLFCTLIYYYKKETVWYVEEVRLVLKFLKILTLSCIMLKNDQTYFINLAYVKIFRVCLIIFQHFHKRIKVISECY